MKHTNKPYENMSPPWDGALFIPLPGESDPVQNTQTYHLPVLEHYSCLYRLKYPSETITKTYRFLLAERERLGRGQEQEQEQGREREQGLQQLVSYSFFST